MSDIPFNDEDMLRQHRSVERTMPSWSECVLLIGLCALPLWAGRFLPLIDVPQHLAMAKVISGLLSGVEDFTKYYELDLWPQPYWLYYVLVGLLGQLVSFELANKLVLLGYSVAIPLGVRSLLLAFGRDPRGWLLAIPLAWSTSFFYGFMPYLMGIPLVLFAIAAFELSCVIDRPGRGRFWTVGILATLVYFSHAQAYLWLLMTMLALLLIHWRGPAWAIRTLAPALPSLLLFGGWIWRTFVAAKPSAGPPEANYGKLWELGMHWEPTSKRVGSAMEHLFGGFTDGSNLWIGWIWLALLTSGVLLGLRTSFRNLATSWPARFRQFRVEILLAIFLFAWLVLPYDVRGQWYLAPRYLVFSGALLIVALSRCPTKVQRQITGLGLLLSAAFSLNVARVVYQFQPAMAGLPEIMAAVPPGERLGYLQFDERVTPRGPDGHATNALDSVIVVPTSVSLHGYITDDPISPEGWLSPIHHALAYYQVWSGGDVAYSFAAAPTNPVRYRPGREAEGPPEYGPETVEFDKVVRGFHWFLVRGTPRGNAMRLGEYAQKVATSGRWELWQGR